MKSRTNFERRQRSIESRLDPSWQPERERPVLEGGNRHYEVSGRVEAISGGGLGLMQSVVEAVGLVEAIDEHLHLLRRHLPYHATVIFHAPIPFMASADAPVQRRVVAADRPLQAIVRAAATRGTNL